MINPLVSVIIPNYNHARYLEQRLDTVFNQTYQNFEVIILDDKSTDNSLEIINRYKDNPHLSQIVVNEQNSGSPFKQWDKGINLAKGDLVWIAESDDYNELTFLEELITEWGKYKNVVVAFSNYVLFTGDWAYKSKEHCAQCFNGIKYIKQRMLRGNQIKNASGVLFEKNIYELISKEYISYKSAGDYLMWVMILRLGNVIKVNKNLSYFRQTVSSVTSSNKRSGITAREDKKVHDYIEKEYSLNWWQKRVAYALKLEYINTFQIDDEELKKEIESVWNKDKYRWKPNSFLRWMIGSVERHLNILL